MEIKIIYFALLVSNKYIKYFYVKDLNFEKAVVNAFARKIKVDAIEAFPPMAIGSMA